MDLLICGFSDDDYYGFMDWYGVIVCSSVCQLVPRYPIR